MKAVAYFGNWDIYGANYFITDVPAENLTHLVYVFANVNTTTGSVILSDTWADLQYAYLEIIPLRREKIPQSSGADGRFVKRLRQSLDQLAEKTDATSPFQISYASPADKDKAVMLHLTSMTPYLDFYTVMALDYMGPGFSNYSGYLSNLFPDVRNPRATIMIQTRALIFTCLTVGFHPTRSFWRTRWQSWYRWALELQRASLPKFDVKVVNVPRVGGSYSYDAKQKYLISYDTPEIAALKAEYVQCLGLAGTAWWEVSMDRNDTLSLIGTTVSLFGGAGALDQSLHNLNYPTSTYVNLKDGFSGN
ncbi:Endochitinase B1 [Penicillium canescens]|nr:Endochitinase B1 [Penicillium canescens]